MKILNILNDFNKKLSDFISDKNDQIDKLGITDEELMNNKDVPISDLINKKIQENRESKINSLLDGES